MAAPVELGASAARARQAQRTAAAKAPEAIPARYAYIVWETEDGAYGLTSNINGEIKDARAPTHDEVFASMHAVLRTIGAARNIKARDVTYAYLVYVRDDSGQFVLTPNLDAPVLVKRRPTDTDIYVSMQVVLKDLVGQQYAGMTAQAILQLNTAIASQMQGDEVMQELMREKGLVR